MCLKSLRLVFVAVLIGMALACLAFLWRSDDQHIKQQSKLNYDDSKVHSSVCGGGGERGEGGGGREEGGLIFYIRYTR